MRFILCRLFPVLFIAALISCSQPAPEPDPKASLAAYFDALIGSNYEEAAKYIAAASPEEAGTKPKEGELFEAKMVRRALAAYVSYEIDITEKTEGKASATVKIKSPDFRRIALDIAARLIAANFPAGGIESLDYTTEIVNDQIRVLKEQGIPMTSAVRKYELVKQDGAWKISARIERDNGTGSQ